MAAVRLEEEEEEEEEVIYKRRRLSSSSEGFSSSSHRYVPSWVVTDDDEEEEEEVIVPLQQQNIYEDIVLVTSFDDLIDLSWGEEEVIIPSQDDEDIVQQITSSSSYNAADNDDWEIRFMAELEEADALEQQIHEEEVEEEEEEAEPELELVNHDEQEEEEVIVNHHNVYTELNDRQVFDCPICLHQLFTPVFQCENSHITCSSCCSKLKRKCPFCCLPIHSRCSGLEKFLQSVSILCKNGCNGCSKTMPYSKRMIKHEQVCQHVTCFCPYPSCSFACSSWLVYRHFDVQHSLSVTRFTYNTTFSVSVEINQNQIFLQERPGSVVFILHHEVQQHGGRAIYVDCVGLKSTFKNMCVYHLSAESMDLDTSLTFKSVPEVHTQLPKHTLMNNYLTVPSALAGDNGILSLSVCIIKDDPSALEVQDGTLRLHDPDVLKVVLNDPAALDCSICLEPLWTPVFQCENAHLACSSCCSKLKSKCSCCGYNYNRCRGLENVIESVGKISCKYAKNGCKETNTYNEKTEHEKDCPRATCFCPHPSSCSFSSSYENLYLHFGIKHAADITRFTYNTTFSLCVDINQEHVFLQEQSGSVILILSHQLQKQGRVFYIDCVGTRDLERHIVYTLTAKSMETSRTLKCVPEIYTKCSKHNEPRKNHLTVPPDFAGYDGVLSLSICINKD